MAVYGSVSFKLQFLRTAARLMVRANDTVFTVHTPHYTRSQVYIYYPILNKEPELRALE